MSQALVGLGSNLGDRRELLDRAIVQLRTTEGVQTVCVSSWHVTKPIGGPETQPEFLNGAALVETSLSPEALWARLQQIEIALGRDRKQRWGPRTIDLDLLLFDDLVRQGSPLELPHPRMAYRRFVLEPAAEIAPSLLHPTIGWTILQLRQHLLTAADYVAVSGSLGTAARTLAANSAAQVGWRLIEFPGENASNPFDNPPSLTEARAIEFLRHQAQLLAIEHWPKSGTGAVSSFWSEDLLAIGDVLWPGKLDAIWQAVSERMVRPKLLICANSTSLADLQNYIGANDQKTSQSAADNDCRKAIRQAIVARAKRPGVGPVLWLDTRDPIAAEIELVAAIQAMS